MKITTNPKQIEADLVLLVVSAQELEVFKKEKTKKAITRKSGKNLSDLSEIDVATGGVLRNALKRSQFKAEQLKSLYGASVAAAPLGSFLLVGKMQDEKKSFERIQYYRSLGAVLAEHAAACGAKRVLIGKQNLNLKETQLIQAFLEGIFLSRYSFLKYRPKQQKQPKHFIEELMLYESPPQKLLTKTLEEATLFSAATMFARDLVNTPARDCTPKVIVEAAKLIAQEQKLRIQVFDKEKLKKIGAELLLAVSQGSSESPYLIKLVYTPTRKAKKVISLVGKGVTFDSGGLSIKTAQGMESMKIDMSGAAAVLGAMKIIGTLKPDVEVRAYIPTTENMINGQATRPGDVVTGLGGKSVEILNTDAEGRLILADALAMAINDKCNSIVDIATLTGACMVALGNEYAGLFSTNEQLTKSLQEAAEFEGERIWEMPLAPEYKELIKSSIADIKNTGGSYGGAITAALFLKEFIDEKTAWAHLDIAGPATIDADRGFRKKGAVGFGVRTLARFVLAQG